MCIPGRVTFDLSKQLNAFLCAFQSNLLSQCDVIFDIWKPCNLIFLRRPFAMLYKRGLCILFHPAVRHPALSIMPRQCAWQSCAAEPPTCGVFFADVRSQLERSRRCFATGLQMRKRRQRVVRRLLFFSCRREWGGSGPETPAQSHSSLGHRASGSGDKEEHVN